MKRKNYWFLFAILLLSLTSLSPSFEFTKNVGNESPGNDPIPPSQTPDIPESDLGPIQVAVQLEGKELHKLKQMNKEFMDQTGAVVEILPLDSIGSNEELFIQKMNLGEGPDVLLVDSQWIKSLAIKGYLLPIDASQAAPDSQLFGGLLPPVQWNGYQWGIPFDMDPYVLALSMTEEQLELPANREEWADYKKNHGDNPVFALDPEDPYTFASAVYTLGGDPEQPDKEVLSMLAPPIGDSWLNLTDTGSMILKSEDSDESAGASIAIGAYSSLSKDLPEGYELILVGSHSDEQKPVVRSRSYAVTAQSESSSLAMAWISEMTSKDAEREWTEFTGKLTVLSNVQNFSVSDINYTQIKPDIAGRVSTLLERGEAIRLNFGRDDGFMDYFVSAADLLYGRITIEDFSEHYEVVSQ
ncbi:ABC transporter substrate-binding protein [Paenibacillus sp. GCM10028914]|uniref:ABC transporter substrate-binding protein n=1 Tax=Paenibacillus sp. GCM10028914 TaxID=3273416 RepID=UPI00360E38DC